MVRPKSSGGRTPAEDRAIDELVKRGYFPDPEKVARTIVAYAEAGKVPRCPCRPYESYLRRRPEKDALQRAFSKVMEEE